MTSPRSSILRRLETDTPLIARAAAGAVVDEAARFLATALPARYETELTCRARRIYASAPAFRRALRRTGDAPRDQLHAFMRHWLAARLRRERPDLFRLLPPGFAAGAALPATRIAAPILSSSGELSNEARLLLAV